MNLKNFEDRPALKLAYSIEEISEMTTLSEGFLRKQIREGKLKRKKYGRRVCVLTEDLLAFLREAGS